VNAGEQLHHTAVAASAALWNALKQNPAMMDVIDPNSASFVTRA
jgi:hypothetical protein